MKLKTIRPRLSIFLAGIVCALSMTACGGEKNNLDARSLAAAVAENLENIQSFEGGIYMDFSMEATAQEYGESLDMEMGFDIDIKSTLDPAASEMTGTMSVALMGEEQEITMEAYSVEEGGTPVVYMDNGSGWVRTVQDSVDEGMLNSDIYRQIADGKIDAELADEEAKVNSQAAYVISASFSGELLEEMLGDTFSSTGELFETDDVDWNDGKAQIKIFVYKESQLPARIEIDCRDFSRAMMESAMFGTMAETIDIKIDAFEVGMTFDAYDSVGMIEIPETVRESAAGEDFFSDEEDFNDTDSEDDTDTDSYGDPLEGLNEELAPNADGTYTIYSDSGSYSATITLMDGQEYCYAAAHDGYFSSMSNFDADENIDYIYQLNEYYTVDEAGEAYTDYAWMEEYEGYSNISCNGVQQMDVDGKIVYWTQLDYVYDIGDGASEIRELTAWTEVGDILLIVEVDETSFDEDVPLTGSEQLLAEALRRVVVE